MAQASGDVLKVGTYNWKMAFKIGSWESPAFRFVIKTDLEDEGFAKWILWGGLNTKIRMGTAEIPFFRKIRHGF